MPLHDPSVFCSPLVKDLPSQKLIKFVSSLGRTQWWIRAFLKLTDLRGRCSLSCLDAFFTLTLAIFSAGVLEIVGVERQLGSSILVGLSVASIGVLLLVLSESYGEEGRR